MAMTMTSTQTRRGSRNSRPKMTAEQARSFSSFSVSSMTQILEARDARSAEGVHPNCECNPYEDFFTFNRWIAQGMAVQKGEHALKIATFTETAASRQRRESADVDEETQTRLRPTTACLFCRCQVKAIEPKAAKH